MSELNHERAIAEGLLVGALPKYEPIPSGWFAHWVPEGTLLIDRRSLPRDPPEITIVSARGSAMRRIVNGWPVVYRDVRVQAVAPPAPTEYHTGDVGRPSGIPLIKREMRRRAETGELLLVGVQLAGVILHELLLAADVVQALDVAADAFLIVRDVRDLGLGVLQGSVVFRDLEFLGGYAVELLAGGVAEIAVLHVGEQEAGSHAGHGGRGVVDAFFVDHKLPRGIRSERDFEATLTLVRARGRGDQQSRAARRDILVSVWINRNALLAGHPR